MGDADGNNNSENVNINVVNGNKIVTFDIAPSEGRGGERTTIFLPAENFTYGSTNDLEDDSSKQFLITSAQPPPIEEDFEGELFLKYVKNEKSGGHEVNWVKDLESLGTFPNKISQTISRNLPVGDFFTDVQTNVDNYNTSTNINAPETIGADTKYKWINLTGTIIDIGLHQLSWNTNKQYYSHTMNSKILPLYCEFENIIDCGLVAKISYLTVNSDQTQTGFFEFTQIENQNKYKLVNKKGEKPQLNCYKVNSIELLPGKNNRTTNLGDIEFFFETKINETTKNNNIEELLLNIPGNNPNCSTLNCSTYNCSTYNCFTYNCFTYNCDYLNCEYYNMYYKKDRTLSKEIIPIKAEDYFKVNLKGIIKETIKEDTYELEGGRGRKAEIEIVNSNKDNSEVKIKITNKGYLYQEGDLLRIKDKKLRNLFFFSVYKLGDEKDESSTLKFTQEYIKAHHGRSNTLKYALGTKESLLIKELNISGSTQSKILVRLIEICKPWKYTYNTENNTTENNTTENNDEKPAQRVIREFYYFNRTNINDVHHINKLIHPESEIYIDIQKLLEVDDDDSKVMDTLTFTLNGIKINLNDVNGNFIMQRDV